MGYGMTFTIGRGNDIVRPFHPSVSPFKIITRSHQVCMAIKQVAARLIGHDTDALFTNMGQAWDHIMSDPQLRWYRPHPILLT
jgi:L-fuconate dehydratase